MNRTDLRCGLTITNPYRSPQQPEVDQIFRIGERINMHINTNISFITFVMLADLYRAFQSMNYNMDSG